jgi:hypothetical protein
MGFKETVSISEKNLCMSLGVWGLMGLSLLAVGLAVWASFARTTGYNPGLFQ